MSKKLRSNLITYALVIVAFIICQLAVEGTIDGFKMITGGIAQYNDSYLATNANGLLKAVKNYDNTTYREQIMYYIVVSNYRLAHDSVAEKQADRYMAMLDSYYSFIEEYPNSEHIKELERYFKEAKDFIDKNKVE